MNVLAIYDYPISKKLARCIRAMLLAFITCSVLPKPALAQIDALSVEDTIRAREFALGSRILFSPDGKWLAYTIIRNHAEDADVARRAQVPSFARGADVYVANVATRREKLVTHGFDNWWPAWSPNSQYLAFLSDRDGSGKPKVWIWDSHIDTLRRISDAPAGFRPLQWAPDGRQIIFSRDADSTEPQGLASDGEAPAPRPQRGSTVTVYAGTNRPDAAPWSLASYSTSLEVTDIDNGKTKTIVRGQIGTYKLSPDGSHLAFTVAERFEEAGSQQILFDLRILDIASGKSQDAIRNLPLVSDGSGYSWSPDGNYLCLRSAGRAVEYFIVSVSGAPPRRLIDNTFPAGLNPREVPLWNESAQKVYFVEEGQLWSGDVASSKIEKIAQVAGRRIKQIIRCSDDVLCIVNRSSVLFVTHDDEGKQDGVYATDFKTGRTSNLIEQGQCYTCILDDPSIAASPDAQRIAFIVEDATHPPNLWLCDTDLQSCRQVTDLNPNFNPHLMGTARLVDWLSDDGEKLRGALLLPSDYRPGKRYPLITYIYGGSHLSDRFDRFGLAFVGPLNMQLFATRGYAVFLPDAPQGPVTPMLDLAKTILPGINKVIELGIADPNRLGVIGHSYGGYSVLSLIVLTTRFKAAIALAGDSDLVSYYGEMSDDGSAYGIPILEEGQGAIGGTPWDRRDKFIENSPFFYLDRIRTPLLIAQGSKDTAVAPFLGDQTFVALRRLGKEVLYAKYEGEGHSPAQEWNYSNQVDLCNRMMRWWDDHLNPP